MSREIDAVTRLKASFYETFVLILFLLQWTNRHTSDDIPWIKETNMDI